MFRASPDVFDFVTLRSARQAKSWTEEACKKRLLGKLREVKKRERLSVAAYVVLDDHAHFLLRAPSGHSCSTVVAALQTDFLDFWRETSAQLPGLEHRSVVGTEQLRAYLDFIHYEPVRHGLVERAAEYRWSSLPTRVVQGHYPEDWAALGPPAAIARVMR